MAKGNNITIEFKAKGNEALNAAIKELDIATKRLAGKASKYEKETKKGAVGNRLLSNSFATLRSKMLLVNFAMGLGINQLIKFGKQAAKVQSMERAFTNLSGGTANASIAVDKLKDATDGTISEFDLFQQANNAMILGVTKNSDEMAKMFDMAQRLGAALGKDTKQSIESLITGIGRQSRLMLDNIGIIVKTEDAYKKYANQLEKNVDQLTDSERKQAFMNATLEAAEEKLTRVGDEVLFADAHFQRIAVSLEELSLTVGEALLPVIEPLADQMVKLSEIDSKDVKEFATAMSLTAGTFVAANIAANAFALGLDAVKLKLRSLAISTGIGAAFVAMTVVLEKLISEMGIFEDSVGDAIVPTKSFADQIKEAEINQKLFNEKLKQGNDLFNDRDILLIKLKEAQGGLTALEARQAILNEKRKDLLVELNGIEDQGSIRAIELTNKRIELDIESQNIKKEIADLELKEDQRKAIAQTRDSAMQEYMLELQSQKEDLDKQEIELSKEIRKLKKQMLDDTVKNAMLGNQSVKDAMINTIKAETAEAIAGYISSLFQTLPFPIAATLSAGAGAFVGGIMNRTLGSSKIPAFEQGGIVGGRRHSQGGTMIEAEQGEFVMSRSAVEAVGIENMNRINQGGGAGITVNVSGNVMTQDFVENDLAEAIKEAARKGADFGIS